MPEKVGRHAVLCPLWGERVGVKGSNKGEVK
jgi:hypothetical protein